MVVCENYKRLDIVSLDIIVEFSIRAKGEVQGRIQRLHVESNSTRLSDETTDEHKVHFWREGYAWIHVHGVDHILEQGEHKAIVSQFNYE